MLDSQRRRMLEAIAAVVAAKGYGSTAVADVIERAGVSRKTFYEHFANKEECFLQAYDVGVELLLGAVDAATRDAGPDPLAAVEAGTRVYLDQLAAHPDFARTFLIEITAAGPGAMARRTAVHGRFAHQLAAGHARAREHLEDVPEPPAIAYRACVGAIHELVTAHLVAHGAERLGELLDPIVRIQFALLIGYADAGRLVAP
ncbi:MAG: TetR/AcrR family transcriptional regulator [Solirubrobacteraceae bacterium]